MVEFPWLHKTMRNYIWVDSVCIKPFHACLLEYPSPSQPLPLFGGLRFDIKILVSFYFWAACSPAPMPSLFIHWLLSNDGYYQSFCKMVKHQQICKKSKGSFTFYTYNWKISWCFYISFIYFITMDWFSTLQYMNSFNIGIVYWLYTVILPHRLHDALQV